MEVMIMFRRGLIIISALFALVGYSSLSDQLKEQLNNLPHHYTQFDVKMAWNIRTVGEHSVIDGVVQNARYSSMEGLEVWVMTMDSKGKETSRSVGFVIPHSLKLDEITTFSVKLPMLAASGAKLVIMYKYDGFDGGGGVHAMRSGGGGTSRMQSFDFIVP